MVSFDCFSNLAILLRSFQILLGFVILATVAYQNPKGALASYFIPLVAGIFSILFYVPLVVPRVLPHITPAIMLAGELVSCLLWKSSLIISSLEFACDRVHPNGVCFTIASFGCSFFGFALSISALILMACGSIRHAWQAGQWNSWNYFTRGGIYQKCTDSDPSLLLEKQPMDDEVNEEGKPQTSLYQHTQTSSLEHIYNIPSSPVSLDLGRSNSRGESFVSISSDGENFSRDCSYNSDCQSTSSFGSLEATSEVSTMKGDNSEIQGIPFADGENDDGGGPGWRRCSVVNSGNFPRFYGE